MRRRRFLAAGSACVAALAGCASAPADPDGSAITPTATTSPTAAGTADRTGATMSVSFEALAPGVVEMTTPDSIGVRGADGLQYLWLEATVESDEPPVRDDLRFRFDGRRHGAIGDDHRLWRGYTDSDGRYDAEAGSGWLVFELPETGDASDAALTWPGGEWRPDDVVAAGDPLPRRLEEDAPPLSVEFSAPETVTLDATRAVSFTVTNEGDVGGRFVAGVNRSGPSIAYTPIEAVSRPIPAGETATWAVTDDYGLHGPFEDELGDGEPDFTYHGNWGGGSASRDVRIVE